MIELEVPPPPPKDINLINLIRMNIIEVINKNKKDLKRNINNKMK
jgi:hypothetical protein